MNLETLVQTANLYSQGVDNLFNANHRNAMLQKYGYSEAMRAQVQFNKLTDKAEFVYDN